METSTRIPCFLAALLGLALVAVAAVPTPAGADYTSRAAALHARLFTIDAHLDTPTFSLIHTGWDFGQRHDPAIDYSQIDLPRMREGGLKAAFFAVWLDQGPRTPAALRAAGDRARRIILKTRETITRNADMCELALTADDGSRIAVAGKRAIYLSLENGYAIGKDLSLLTTYQQLGVRMAGITHWKNNDLGDSSTDEKPEWNGLSPLGRDYVRECNRLGLVIDASHVSDAALREVLAISRAPIVLSHSGCKALNDHPRNIDDELLRALAAKGGVIHFNALDRFVVPLPKEPAFAAAEQEFEKTYLGRELSDAEIAVAEREWQKLVQRFYPVPRATLDDYLRHFAHAIKVAGIDHVGIGTDMDGGGRLIGLQDASDYPKITLALLQRGYSEADIAKIWGGNTLRVLRAAEDCARSLQRPQSSADSAKPIDKS
jgi:membrane dipeptidase